MPTFRLPATARSRWLLAVVVAVLAVTAALVVATVGTRSPQVPLPPPGAGFDYQIGGGYDLPEGVEVVSRDRADPPADGAYNICYVNGFQVQPDELDAWDADLVLRSDGARVVDPDWDDEYVLDISEPAKRERVAAVVNRWITGCAEAGYDAVEIDNLDTFDRFPHLIDEAAAIAFARMLVDHAHELGLAAAQKNAAELSDQRERTGFDFVVAEECGRHHECGDYTEVYGDHVVVVEYDDAGLAWVCEHHPELSVVERDLLVVTPEEGEETGDDEPGYVRRTCADVGS